MQVNLLHKQQAKQLARYERIRTPLCSQVYSEVIQSMKRVQGPKTDLATYLLASTSCCCCSSCCRFIRQLRQQEGL